MSISGHRSLTSGIRSSAECYFPIKQTTRQFLTDFSFSDDAAGDFDAYDAATADGDNCGANFQLNRLRDNFHGGLMQGGDQMMPVIIRRSIHGDNCDAFGAVHAAASANDDINNSAAADDEDDDVEMVIE